MHYHILFLVMSCNNSFFEMSRKVVHDTWAKHIVQGDFEKYGNIGFYSYTSSTTGNTYIQDNCVYVNEPDELNFTYNKTIHALKFLQENDITWDIVVRTNTSTYINVENTILLANKYEGNYMGFFSRLSETLFAYGWYMFLPKVLTDGLIKYFDEFNDYTKNDLDYSIINFNNHELSKYDDLMIGICRDFLIKKYNYDIPICILGGEFVQHYKSFIENPYIQDPSEREGIYKGNQNKDPKKIFECVAMQVRLPGVKTQYRYIELEHMYELYNEEYNKNE